MSTGVRIGLDMSLNSTGMAIIEGKNISLIFKPQTKQQHHINWQSDIQGYHVTIRPFSFTKTVPVLKPGTTSSSREKKRIQGQKVAIVIDAVLQEIQTITQDSVTVYIEDYAYGMTNSSSLSVLHELGGALKYMLAKKNIAFETISPSSAKKRFTGSGRATKVDMYAALQNQLSIPLWTIFGKKKPGAKIPNPIQDIVDAFALAWIQ